jgi:hypothetical protein
MTSTLGTTETLLYIVGTYRGQPCYFDMRGHFFVPFDGDGTPMHRLQLVRVQSLHGGGLYGDCLDRIYRIQRESIRDELVRFQPEVCPDTYSRPARVTLHRRRESMMYFDEDGRMYRREFVHASEIPEIDEAILTGNPIDRIYESSLDHASYTLLTGLIYSPPPTSDDLASRAPMSSTPQTPPTSRSPLGSTTPRQPLPSSTIDSPRTRVLDH